MTHPHDDLVPYLLDDLDASERARVEDHLATCEACRRELRTFEEAYVAMVERLPSEAPPPRVWAAVAERTGVDAEPPRVPGPVIARARPVWGALAMAAAITIAATGILWGWDQRQNYLDLRAEQAQIARWLSQPSVQARSFVTEDETYGGAVLFQSDGRALVVMRDQAPPRRSYQAWGIGADGAVSLGVLEDRTLEVPAEGFAQIAVSLEPEGGSPAPTIVLGGVPTS